jgi:hypothetical protein
MIAWSSEEHTPGWELQTEHRGFANWLTPALFAHGATVPAPRFLHVSGSRAELELNTGDMLEIGRHQLSFPGLTDVELTIWQLGLDVSDHPTAACDAYQKVLLSSSRPLASLHLDGEWRPTSYDVRGPEGRVPLLIECDDSGAILTVALDSSEPPATPQDIGAITFTKP